MSALRTVDPELSDFLADCLQYRVLEPGSPEAALAASVARKGLRGLTKAERVEWEAKVLPVISLPIDELLNRATFGRPPSNG